MLVLSIKVDGCYTIEGRFIGVYDSIRVLQLSTLSWELLLPNL